MTTNHPAHGPVSLERLHQIHGILSKASAQSDGGNLGYAMVDAVKVIDSAIAAFDAEPVAWTEKCEITNMQATGLYLRGFPNNAHGRDIALYTAPPAPVSVPAAMEMDDDFDSAFEHGKAVGWNAYRAAMLQGADGNAPAHFRSRPAQSSLSPAQGGNSPVIPEGWVMVPIEPTADMREAYHQAQAEYEDVDGLWSPDHQWQAMLAAAPKQEAK